MAQRINGMESLIGLQRASPPIPSSNGSQAPVSSGPFDQILLNALARKGTATGVPSLMQLGNPSALSASLQATLPEQDEKFRKCLEFVLAHEGKRYVARDGARESSKYGILQATAREYGYTGDIKDITRDEAEAIYRKIWERSGARDLPLPLSLVHFDTYVNSPAAARRFLTASGGDTETYIRARGLRYNRLARSRPQVFAKYLKGWTNRLNDLSKMVARYNNGVSRA